MAFTKEIEKRLKKTQDNEISPVFPVDPHSSEASCDPQKYGEEDYSNDQPEKNNGYWLVNSICHLEPDERKPPEEH